MLSRGSPGCLAAHVYSLIVRVEDNGLSRSFRKRGLVAPLSALIAQLKLVNKFGNLNSITKAAEREH